MGRRIAGQTIREIARAENLSKNTVSRILSQDEVDILIQTYRSIILEEVLPLALESLKYNLKKNHPMVTMQTLFGTKVLSQHHELEMKEPSKRDYSSAMVRYYYEFGKWPTKEEAKEFDKTIPVEPLIKGEDSKS